MKAMYRMVISSIVGAIVFLASVYGLGVQNDPYATAALMLPAGLVAIALFPTYFGLRDPDAPSRRPRRS